MLRRGFGWGLVLFTLALVATQLFAPAEAGRAPEPAPPAAPVTARLAIATGARGLAPEVLDTALKSLACARARGLVSEPESSLLTVIDYSLPSTERRLWVLDLLTGEVRFHERVAHGRNSGEDRVVSFSNVEGSLQSSLGVFRTAGTYIGANGYSLLLDGLEPGFNDRARERHIVVHGADYNSEAFIAKAGRLGRSWGCPALPLEVTRALIDTIRGGTLFVSYYPDPAWLSNSHLLSCS